MKLILSLFVLLTIAYTTEPVGVRKIHNKPKIMGDLIPLSSLNTMSTKVQRKIVLMHNHLRANVKPKAANMLKMTWHKGAAKVAQKWANTCVYLQHDEQTSRTLPNFGVCGQNIFVSSQKVPWVFAIKSWFSEKDDFLYGRINDPTKVVGHYTQLVWATSHKVGCGMAKCHHKDGRIFYNYVCDYCPSGNFESFTHKPYKAGKPCSLCKGKCQNKLCTNSCNFTNMYSNCYQLFMDNPTNFCKGANIKSSCKATCQCKNKIYEKFD